MNATTRSLVVLLVEDDPLVRMAAAEMIELSGHEVRQVQNAEAALGELEAEPDINVLVTDLRLGGMLGEELVLEALRNWPRLKVIVVSGAKTEKLTAVKDRIVFLAKPFAWDQLIAAIEK